MSTFGLPDETRVSQVHLRTTGIRGAMAFYRDVLGFAVINQSGPDTMIAAAPGGPPLLVLTEDRSAVPRPRRTTGLYHFAIRYPTRRDLAWALQRLARNDYSIEGASDHLVSEAIYLSDPDGNGVELYADRPRSQWVWRNGQVTMSTEPLDMDDLLQTIKGQLEPSAPPPNTDIGHVHLHVAELAAAERFYRELIGLAVTQRSYPGALFLSAGGYHHHIAVNTWAGQTPAPPGSVGLISYRLEVPVAEILYCLGHRAPLVGYEAKMEKSETGGDLLQIRDPNGNWLEIQAAVTSPKV